MGDDAELWRKYKAKQKEEKWARYDMAVGLLKKTGINYKVVNQATPHFRMGDFDLWPTTGKFKNTKTGERGFGITNLIRKIKRGGEKE